MRYVLLVAMLVLAGCESEAELRAQRQARIAQAEASEHRQCVDFGLEHGTPEYADCRLQLRQIRANNEAARRAAILQYYMGRPQPQAPAPTYQPPVMKGPTTTNCTDMGGGMISCTTY